MSAATVDRATAAPAEPARDPELSIVIPVLNEAGNLAALHGEIAATLAPLALEYEVVFVDDGSDDGTWEALTGLAVADPRLVLARHRRRRGKAAALSSGFSLARGAILVTMDGDLQDDPREIPALLDTLAAGHDLVSGWKHPRLDPWHKTLPSRLFNLTVRLLFRLPLHDFNCGFKAYRREVIEDVNLYGELHRFIPVLAAAQGYAVGERIVRHRPRRWGRSKYGFERLTRGLFDAITVYFLTRYPERPLHLFGLIGIGCAFLGGLICLVLSLEWFFADTVLSQRPLLLLGILLVILSVQFFSIGLLGELIINRSQTALRPERHIREVLRAGERRDGRAS